MQQVSREEFERGKRNFAVSLGLNRRDFLKAGMAVPAAGAFYFGYGALHGSPVRAGIVGTGNEGCDAMIKQSPPDYLQYVAYHDIRPSQIARAPKAFASVYGDAAAKNIKFHEQWKDMLADPSIEAIVVATPLWTHAKFTIEALEAGKHVLCEKLMAHNITDAKRMIRAADKAGKLLAIGHQRHYSTLYEDALHTIRSGVLGDVKHIRALWHRNNTETDGWKPEIPAADKTVDFAKYGYKSLEELVRWRLYNRTGGGLMAELGSHQLDACSIFLGKVHPKAVSGVGGKFYYTDDRECEDHVYCTFEMPNGVVVTYSSINTNALEGYGEIVMGTRGTMMVMRERDVALFTEIDPLKKQREDAIRALRTNVKIGQAKPGEATMYSNISLGLSAAAAKTSSAPVSRGYKEEMEHFAYAIRNPGAKVRCDGRVALADAVMALTSNIAMRTKKRIEFKDAWYDPASDECPESLLPKQQT